MNKAQQFFKAVDEFPGLAALILPASRSEGEVMGWIEDGDLDPDEFDVPSALSLAEEATKSTEEDIDGNPVDVYVWDDGSRVVLVWGTDQDPDEMRIE